MKDEEHCSNCAFAYSDCDNVACIPIDREDATQVIFKKVEQTKIKPMEVKIQIPDNCELIKDGDTYIVKEKKQEPPRSWEEFCEKYPKQLGEVKIDSACNMYEIEKNTIRHPHADRNVNTSKEEAEAFLALMQLRQLRKAWIGDWEIPAGGSYAVIYPYSDNLKVDINTVSRRSLSFPTKPMAEDFLNCFKDLCETAKILL